MFVYLFRQSEYRGANPLLDIFSLSFPVGSYVIKPYTMSEGFSFLCFKSVVKH